MNDTLQMLIELYAEANDMTKGDAWDKFRAGSIDKYELLESYLEYEGIIGYTRTIYDIFQTLAQI